LLTSPDVAYPEAAQGAASVVLELSISAEGAVSDARVIEGSEPFALAAQAAALSWRFTPATRDGAAMAARIRFEVRFVDPALAAIPPAEPSQHVQASAPTPPASAPSAPVEVRVRGKRGSDHKRLSKAEVRQMPGAFGDPFRAIEALPGVTPMASGLPYFFVRGAPPGNVGYFFDGIPVPALYHAVVGPAVIHPSFVEDVTLYSGAYPARYGRFAGGIVAGTSAPPAYRLRGEANIRLVDSGALVEVPFDDEHGSVMLAGRYSYTGAMVSLLAPEVEIGYWDYQGRIKYNLSSRDSLSVFGFGSYDFLSAEDDDGVVQDVYDFTFHRLEARYDRKTSETSALRVATMLGLDRTAAGERLDLETRRIQPRLEYRDRLSDRVQLHTGADLEYTKLDIVLDPDGEGDDDPPQLSPYPLPGLPTELIDQEGNDAALRALFKGRERVVAGAWLETGLDLGQGVTLTPGFRLDVYDLGEATLLAPEPRINVRYELSPRVSLIHDFGIAHQAPSFAVPVPGLEGDSGSGLQTGVLSSAGTEIDLGNDFVGSFTLFQNVLFEGTDAFGLMQLQRADPEIDNDTDRATAHSYGFEVYLRRPLTHRLGGFLSYTLSRSTRALGRIKAPSSFDRTHVLNLALAYDLGRAWRIGGRLLTYTGIPGEVAYVEATKNPPRTPIFYRIDWRLEKRWRLGKTGFWAFVVEVLNTTLHKETLELSCYAYGCTTEEIGPVTVPSIGLEAAL
jgi:TonB family protein